MRILQEIGGRLFWFNIFRPFIPSGSGELTEGDFICQFSQEGPGMAGGETIKDGGKPVFFKSSEEAIAAGEAHVKQTTPWHVSRLLTWLERAKPERRPLRQAAGYLLPALHCKRHSCRLGLPYGP